MEVESPLGVIYVLEETREGDYVGFRKDTKTLVWFCKELVANWKKQRST